MSSNGAPRVLIVTYEFPPSGGGGVQRVAKFARYLSDFGWSPVVVTAEPVVGRPRDESLLDDVADVPVQRVPARNPSVAIARTIAPIKRIVRPGASGGAATTSVAGVEAGASGDAGSSRVSLSARIARRFTLDDAALWVRRAVEAAVDIGRADPVDAVFASGPPFTVTDAGVRIAGQLGVPLVVDLRDAWRDNPVAYYPNDAARARSVDLEQRVMAAADAVTVTTTMIGIEAAEMGAVRVEHLPNGYDPRDVVAWSPTPGPLRLCFMGKVYRGHSDPWVLLDAMGELRERRPDLDIELEFIGEQPAGVAEAAVARRIADKVSFAGYLPHREAVRRVAASDVAVQLIADRPGATAAIGGKVFEYLGIGIPVLVLGPKQGATAELIESAGAGWIVSAGDAAAIAGVLERLAAEKGSGLLSSTVDRDVAARYDRRALTGELARVLDSVRRGAD